MFKVALVKLPSTYANWHQRPIVGLAYLAGVLKQNGYEAKIFDGFFNNWSVDRLVQEIVAYSPDAIGFTAMTQEITQASFVASQIRSKHACTTVIGGCHLTALPERTLSDYPVFDYGVIGEGEKTIVELVKYLEQPNLYEQEHIPGIIYRNGDSIRINDARPFLTNAELDALPFPDFSDYYGDNTRALSRKNDVYAIFTSRGCPYDCLFCMQLLGRKVRQRSTENIIAEIEMAIRKFGAHTFDFLDEIFLMDRPVTRKLLQYFIDSGLSKKIRWTGLTRANIVNADLIDLARRSGCICLAMGVEAGDDEILVTVRKKVNIQQIKRAVAIVKNAGISLNTYYILGHPGETRATANKTVELAAELNTDNIAIGLMVPFPGTEIYNLAKNNKMGYSLLSERWEEYDKYGGRALKIEGLPYEELERLQMKAIAKLYYKNHRWLDLLSYSWAHRMGVYFFVKKKLHRLKDDSPTEPVIM